MDKIRIITHRYGYMGLECNTVVEVEGHYDDNFLFTHNGKKWTLKDHQGDFEFMGEDGEIKMHSGASISFTQSGDSIVSTFNPSLETRKNGKNQMELVDTGFPNALMAIGEVMTWAAENKGYLANDWKGIPNPSMSLLGAASRHRNKRLKGEEFDDESGLLHLAHEAFNVLAQLELLLIGKL